MTVIFQSCCDAKMICNYAKSVDLRLWTGQSKDQQECLQTVRILSVYTKQSTMLKNKIHGEEVLGVPSKLVLRSIKRSLKSLQKEIKKIEEKLHELIKKEHQELLTLVESIPGIGRKTGVMLLVLTDGFKRFSSASELCPSAPKRARPRARNVRRAWPRRCATICASARPNRAAGRAAARPPAPVTRGTARPVAAMLEAARLEAAPRLQ